MEFMDKVVLDAAVIQLGDIPTIPGLPKLTVETTEFFEHISGGPGVAGKLTSNMTPEFAVCLFAATVAQIPDCSPRKAAIMIFSYLLRKQTEISKIEGLLMQLATEGQVGS